MDTAASIDFAGALGEIGYLACRTMPWLLYTYGVLSSVGAAASPRSSLPFHHHHSQSNPDLLASWSLRGPHESPGPFNRTTRRATSLTRGWPRGLHANSADAPSLYRVNEASLSFLNNPLIAFSGSARASRPRLRSSGSWSPRAASATTCTTATQQEHPPKPHFAADFRSGCAPRRPAARVLGPSLQRQRRTRARHRAAGPRQRGRRPHRSSRRKRTTSSRHPSPVRHIMDQRVSRNGWYEHSCQRSSFSTLRCDFGEFKVAVVAFRSASGCSARTSRGICSSRRQYRL